MKAEVAREEKAPRETAFKVYDVASFLQNEKKGKEKKTCDVLPSLSPHLGETTHIAGGTMKSLLDQGGLKVQLGTVSPRMGHQARCCASSSLL